MILFAEYFKIIQDILRVNSNFSKQRYSLSYYLSPYRTNIFSLIFSFYLFLSDAKYELNNIHSYSFCSYHVLVFILFPHCLYVWKVTPYSLKSVYISRVFLITQGWGGKNFLTMGIYFFTRQLLNEEITDI